MAAPDDSVPAGLKAWRRAERERLIAARMAMPSASRRAARDQVHAILAAEVPELRGATIGFYWPFRAEIDLVGFVRDLTVESGRAALPVVVAKAQPLVFWRWRHGMEMRPGIWDIPVPAVAEPVAPDCLLVPLVGFDDQGYRLGYGGGYYDRTIPTLPRRPLLLGIGYASQHLPSVHPQPHDLPMDAIVTEAGIRWHRRPARDMAGEEPIECSSPPCYLHEL